MVWTNPGYLSVAGEGGVIEQEVGAEKHDDGVVNAQNGPVYKGGPSQQRVLGNISAEKREISGKCNTERSFIYSFQSSEEKKSTAAIPSRRHDAHL